MSNIYYIEGCTSFGMDFTTWIVAAFTTEDKAKAYLERLEAHRDSFIKSSASAKWDNASKLKAHMRELDPSVRCDYVPEYTIYGTRLDPEPITYADRIS